MSAAGKTLTRPRAVARAHPLPQCGRGLKGDYFSSNFAPGGIGTSNTFKVTDTKE